MAEGARTESVYTATYRGFESPPHRHIRDESLYESTGSFLLYSPQGGMRTPDRGSTTGAASWTDRARSKRAAPQGRAKRVNPPLTAIFKMRACTKVRALFFIFSTGDENPDRGSTTGAASWTDRARSKRAARASEAVNPPHRHIQDESLYESTGSFLLYSPQGGMRTPDRGSTTGAASWTDRARSKRAAQGRAKRVNPPHRHIQDEPVRKYGLFSLYSPQGDENPRPGFDNWRSQLDRPRTQ